MMKRLLLFILFLTPLFALADDTAALQTLLNAGNVTLPASGTYYVTGLTVKYSFNLNGSTINMTSSTGSAIQLNTKHASISNGNVFGNWPYSTAGNPSGNIGIRILADSCTITSVHVSQFAAYGILCGAYQHPVITGSTIDKTGYIGFYFDPEANNINNGVFTNNTVDRSMIASSSVQNEAIAIRASTANPADSTRGWTITGNAIKMPYNPSQAAAECMEVRYMSRSTISNNYCYQGTIGLSIVRSAYITVSNNQTVNSRDEGIEFADTWHSTMSNNDINGSLTQGILLDGSIVYSKYNTLAYDTVTNVTTSAIHFFTNAKHNTISYCQLTTPAKGINMQGADSLTVNNTVINGGSHSGTSGIFFDGALGNTTINNGSIINCSYAVNAYNTSSSAVVNNIIGYGVTLTGTTTQFSGTFSGGAMYGTNNHFYASLLPVVTYPSYIGSYKIANIPIYPINTGGAVTSYSATLPSGLSINTSTGVITGTPLAASSATNYQVIAINGTGSDTTNWNLTVNKATLAVIADNKYKTQGQPNPVLTISYISSVPGDSSPTLTTYPTASTSATTGSPAGTYSIIPSGAVTPNYVITYVNGALVIYSRSVGGVLKGHKAVIATY